VPLPVLPAPIVSRLSGEMRKLVESGDVKNRILADGAEPVGGTPKQFQDHLASEMARAKQIIQRAGLQP
jgi:tripartite-type tricarboxylate transporter receptor subunit TctC